MERLYQAASWGLEFQGEQHSLPILPGRDKRKTQESFSWIRDASSAEDKVNSVDRCSTKRW